MKKVAAGPVVQLVACVLLSVQTAWCETIAAAAGDGGGGFDGAEDKKCQLCACSSYSATHKTYVSKSNNFARKIIFMYSPKLRHSIQSNLNSIFYNLTSDFVIFIMTNTCIGVCIAAMGWSMEVKAEMADISTSSLTSTLP